MPEHRYPTECWLTPHARVSPSAIEGHGLFANAPIGEGEVVMTLGGTVIDDQTLASLTPPYSSLSVEDGVHLLLDPAHPVRYGNHCCDPNLWHTSPTTLAARRPIAPGEELTIDYATHTGFETWTMDCRCGSQLCRGTVSGNDWRLPELQSAYQDHWTPPLIEKINRGAAAK